MPAGPSQNQSISYDIGALLSVYNTNNYTKIECVQKIKVLFLRRFHQQLAIKMETYGLALGIKG